MDGFDTLTELPPLPTTELSLEAMGLSRHSIPKRARGIWAIGGGKGGVGKSLISSSLAVSLARFGFRVIAIDLDLGAANLHTSLGIAPPATTLSDFFSR